MKALFYESFGQIPRVVDLPDPSPPKGGVVIEVGATGICRSDWHGWMGHDPDIQLPHVPGHEFAGRIVALGEGVRGWKIGDRVTAPFCLGCGTCYPCRRGNQHICDQYQQPGFTLWGSFAEYLAIPYAATNLVRLPDAVNMAEAALLGCRFTTAYRAMVHQGRLKAGEWVAVHGCGGVGLSALLIARAKGARTIGIDIDADKLALAAGIGLDVTLNATDPGDVAESIIALTEGGAHLSIDALGSVETISNSINCLAKQGRHIQVGLLGKAENPPLPVARIISHELEILGSHGMQAHAYPEIFELMRAGKLNLTEVLGRRIRLEEAPEALAAMGQFSDTGVTLIEFDHS